MLIFVALHFTLFLRTTLRTTAQQLPWHPEFALSTTLTIYEAIFHADFSRPALYFAFPYHCVGDLSEQHEKFRYGQSRKFLLSSGRLKCGRRTGAVIVDTKQRDRVKVLHAVTKEHLTQAGGAAQMGVSERWVDFLCLPQWTGRNRTSKPQILPTSASGPCQVVSTRWQAPFH